MPKASYCRAWHDILTIIQIIAHTGNAIHMPWSAVCHKRMTNEELSRVTGTSRRSTVNGSPKKRCDALENVISKT